MDIYDDIYESNGGLSNSEAISDLPRNLRQIKNVRAKISSNLATKNTFGTFQMEAKDNSDFIHNFEAAAPTGPRAVLASHFQMTDIESIVL